MLCAQYDACFCSGGADLYSSVPTCCAICPTWAGGVSGNDVNCRSNQLGKAGMAGDVCLRSGPWSDPCGTAYADAREAYGIFCKQCPGMACPGLPVAADTTTVEKAVIKAVNAELAGNTMCAQCYCLQASSGVNAACMACP